MHYQPVRKTVTQIIDKSIKPLANQFGFKKSGFNFYCRQSELTQVINVQLSRYNFGATGGFYINIGIAFDKLYELKGAPIVEKPQAYKCHFCRRLAHFYPTSPDSWPITETTDSDEIALKLTEYFKFVFQELHGVSSISTFLTRQWLHQGADYGLLAQLQYVLGDLDAARQAIHLESEYFSDRQGMSVQALIVRYRLSLLE